MNTLTILADYSLLGIKLIIRKPKNSVTSYGVIGFIKSTDDPMAGALFPHALIHHKKTDAQFRTFPTNPNNIPRLTIRNYQGGVHNYSREFSVRIRYRKWGFIPWTCDYDLIPKQSFPSYFMDYKGKKSTVPIFTQVMYIEWEDHPLSDLQDSVKKYDSRVSSSRQNLVYTKHICSLTNVLGRYGKGPYIVWWSGQGFTIYSLEGKHLFGINEAKYDDDGTD